MPIRLPYYVAVHANLATMLGGDAAMVQATSGPVGLTGAKPEALRQLAKVLTIKRGQRRRSLSHCWL